MMLLADQIPTSAMNDNTTPIDFYGLEASYKGKHRHTQRKISDTFLHDRIYIHKKLAEDDLESFMEMIRNRLASCFGTKWKINFHVRIIPLQL